MSYQDATKALEELSAANPDVRYQIVSRAPSAPTRETVQLTVPVNKLVMLLAADPTLASSCNFNFCNGATISRLLQIHPKLIDSVDLEVMTGSDIALLLQYHPQLTYRFDMTKLGGADWVALLNIRPELSKFCDFMIFDSAELELVRSVLLAD
jgi:hypothetical protein